MHTALQLMHGRNGLLPLLTLLLPGPFSVINLNFFSHIFIFQHFAFLLIHCVCVIFLFDYICSFDVRDKVNNDQPRHWSAPEVFGSRAKFHIDSQPATLEIKVGWLASRLTNGTGLSLFK